MAEHHQNTSTRQDDHQNTTRTPASWEKAKAFWSAVHDNIGIVPLLAPLILAGYYQADLARTAFEWAFPWYLLFPLSIEAGAAWAAGNYHRKLVVGDSTIGARTGMLAYASASGALLYWHARDTDQPLATALAVSGMTLAAMWIWTQRAKHAKRDILRQRGLVDKQVPRFSAPRWILCPIETAHAFRWAVKHSIDDPAAALEEFRAQDRTETLVVKADQYKPIENPSAVTDISRQPHAVYEIRDAEGTLLYVGATSLYRKGQDAAESLLSQDSLANAAVRRRLAEHRKKQPWADRIEDVTVLAIHPDRAAALKAEQEAIEATYPEHNIRHNPKRAATKRPTESQDTTPAIPRPAAAPRTGDAELIQDIQKRYPSWRTTTPSINDIKAVLDEGKTADEPRTGQTRASRFQHMLITIAETEQELATA